MFRPTADPYTPNPTIGAKGKFSSELAESVKKIHPIDISRGLQTYLWQKFEKNKK